MSALAQTRALPAGRRGPLGAPAVGAFLAFGLLAPSSVNGSIGVGLVVAHSLIASACFVYLAVVRGCWGTGPQVWAAAAVFAVVVGASVLSPFAEWAPGALVGFTAIATLFALDLQPLTPVGSLRPALLVASLLVAVAGVAVAAGSEVVRDVLIRYYSAAYPELVPYMTLARKPVFTFGSHSIAGFFYFLFFYLNFETARAGGGRVHLALAVVLAAVGFFLTSVTALALMSAAFGLMLVRRSPGRPLVWVLTLGAVAAAALFFRAELQELTLIVQFANTLGFEGSGLSGRYSAGGNLAGNLDYLALHPLRPIGLTYSPDLFFGDSGPIEYLLRGSLPLLLAVYGALGLFIHRSVVARGDRLVLVGVVLVFEVGFTILTYQRFHYLLAFAILYLNQLRRDQRASAPAPAPAAHPPAAPLAGRGLTPALP